MFVTLKSVCQYCSSDLQWLPCTVSVPYTVVFLLTIILMNIAMSTCRNHDRCACCSKRHFTVLNFSSHDHINVTNFSLPPFLKVFARDVKHFAMEVDIVNTYNARMQDHARRAIICAESVTRTIIVPTVNSDTLTTKNLVDEKFGPLQILCPNFSSTKFFAVQIFRQVSNQVTLKDRI